MNFGISGKTAIVTGASSGLGRACALALASAGVRLALAARRADRLEETAAQARAAGSPDARAFVTDLTRPESIEALVRDARAAFGPIAIAIANSGGPKPATFTQASLDDWDQAYRAVLRSMLHFTGLVLPDMRAQRWGRIVALTSTSVKQPIGNLVLSNALRTALVSALKTLAGEVACEGITVNSIATGRVETERLRSLYGDEQKMRDAGSGVPIGRIAQVEEFAPLIAFLCSEQARYVAGQTIAIDGGLVAGLFG